MSSTAKVAAVLLLSTTMTCGFNLPWGSVKPWAGSAVGARGDSCRREERVRLRGRFCHALACRMGASDNGEVITSLAAIADMERKKQQEEELRNSDSIMWECLKGTLQSKQELREEQRKHGADVASCTYPAPEPLMKFMKKGKDRVADVISSFAPVTQEQVIEAFSSGALLADLSHWGGLVVTGEDRYKFVSGLCTNRVVGLKPGDVRPACFLSKVGRTVDLTTLAVLSDSILILCSPNRVLQLFQDLDALIFPKDKVKCLDISDGLARFHILGPKAEELISRMKDLKLPGPFRSSPLVLDGRSMNGLVLQGAGCSAAGYTLVASAGDGKVLWEELMRVAGPEVVCVGQTGWEVVRTVDGVRAEREKSLWTHLWVVSTDKGCYIGQESMARLKVTLRGGEEEGRKEVQ
eukprot:752804-Hanusia_phi.AAC.2